jgi:hypothetical protein
VFLYRERVKDMRIVEFVWDLGITGEEIITRHCPNCNRRAAFHDSGRRRHNANGKNIYRYAIYECENGHTWKKFLGNFKAGAREADWPESFSVDPETKKEVIPVNIEDCVREGFTRLEILLGKVEGKWRLDKVLAGRLTGWSRSRIAGMIADGLIKVDGAEAEPGMPVKSGQTIGIEL